MPNSVSFRATDGRDPSAVILDLRAAISPNVSDGLYGGQMVRTFVRDDAANGVDVDGNPLAPYSDAYLKQRQKHGLGGNVDLFGFQQHDHMLNGILVKSGGQESDGTNVSEGITDPITSFQVGIYSEELAARAEYNNEGTSRMPARRVFGVNEQKVQQIEQAIGQRCEMRARALLKG